MQGKDLQVAKEAAREAKEAMGLLTSFEGNGWLCPVTISVAVEAAVNAYEATDKVVAALTALGIDVRPARREEGR